MSQPTVFRIDTPAANGEYEVMYVTAPTLADVQYLVFGTAARVATVLRTFKEKADFSLPEDNDAFRSRLTA